MYNRVGKTGSSSMISLLTSLCLCREFTLPGDWHYWAFDSGDASSDQTTLRQHHLHQAVRSLAATRTEKPLQGALRSLPVDATPSRFRRGVHQLAPQSGR